MEAPAPHSTKYTQFGPYAADVDDGCPDTPIDLEPGERIGRPLVNARRKLAVRAIVVGGLIAIGSWTWLNHQATLTAWASVASAALTPLLQRKAPDPDAQNLSPMPQRATAQNEPSPIRVPAAAAPAPAAAAADMDAVASPPEKLPPPVVDTADPYQKRALAVGLHPDLSRVLLAKLTVTDYRNAGVAIKTALTKTLDTDVFVWPRQRSSELALFQVKFVPGAATDCRRYVVMVAKDGWLTTALPMEKCGIQLKGKQN